MNIFDVMAALTNRWRTYDALQGYDGLAQGDRRRREILELLNQVMELWPAFEHGHMEASVELEKYRRYIVRARTISIDVEALDLCEDLAIEGFFDPMPTE